MSQKHVHGHVYASNHDCFGNPTLIPDGASFPLKKKNEKDEAKK